ncbi:ERF family protein [Rhizobium ruizarguesonis]|uniref:ERF family protein n=1 Tax=Rhizobium ruizarguesonis TaxID=2081791 RepID=UPI00103065C1|nr:ERF family protein [Rhizobium ruizarguesonis]TBA16128.1 hypothetical protein ELH65_09175 [Rhizobium ruizarguesonis]
MTTSASSRYSSNSGCHTLPHLSWQISRGNKLAIIQHPVASVSGSCTLETILRHAPTGEEISSLITIPMQRQNDPQEFGAAMTYGRRYSLLCLFGMVPPQPTKRLHSSKILTPEPSPIPVT